MNLYMISKKLADIILFLCLVKDGVFMLEACDNSGMKHIFSRRSLAFGKLCFACLEFLCALYWIHYSVSSVVICSVVFKGCCLLSAGGYVSVMGEAMLLIGSFVSFCQVLWDCYMKDYISVIYYYECLSRFGI